MPVHRYDIQSRHDRQDLVAAIAEELRNGLMRPVAPPIEGAPDIYLKEGPRPDRPVRIYVVWDKWTDVPEVQRSGIIVDALTEAGLKEYADRTVISMGLTRPEADALGIN